MTPILLVTAVIAMWTAATILWILDAPDPRHTVDTVLTTHAHLQDPVVERLRVAA